jgi:DNA primase
MGAHCSEEQAKLILDWVEFDGRIWILSDGDDGGTRLAQNLFERVAPYRPALEGAVDRAGVALGR